MTTATPAAQLGGLTSLAAALLAGSLTVPPSSPADVDAPGGPRPAAAPYGPLAADAPAADRAAVEARLAGPLSDPVLGNPAGFVVDALTGQVLLDRASTTLVAPASTLKTTVAAAALTTFGPLDTIVTRVVYDPAAGGTLWLVGAGDPTLTAAPSSPSGPADGAHLDDLARQVAGAGITAVGTVVGDGTMFTGPQLAVGWRDTYVSTGNVTPVTALSVDGGRPAPGSLGPRSGSPESHAAGRFALALREAGVAVAESGAGGAGPAPAGARQVASAHSVPIPALVERMLLDSDNDLAESLGRLVAVEHGLPATFDGATEAVLDALRALDVPVEGARLDDVSGLSTTNLIAPATLVTLLRTAASPDHPLLRPILTGLPVAGFSGTLGDRYLAAEAAAGAGTVRAKTGSLRVVTSLAGQVVDADGRLLLFGFFAPVEEAGTTRTALDRVAVALAGCGCSTGGSTSGSTSATGGAVAGP